MSKWCEHVAFNQNNDTLREYYAETRTDKLILNLFIDSVFIFIGRSTEWGTSARICLCVLTNRDVDVVVACNCNVKIEF